MSVSESLTLSSFVEIDELYSIHLSNVNYGWWTTCIGKRLGSASPKRDIQVLWKNCIANRLHSSPNPTLPPHRWLCNKLWSWSELPCDYIGTPISYSSENKKAIKYDFQQAKQLIMFSARHYFCKLEGFLEEKFEGWREVWREICYLMPSSPFSLYLSLLTIPNRAVPPPAPNRNNSWVRCYAPG